MPFEGEKFEEIPTPPEEKEKIGEEIEEGLEEEVAETESQKEIERLEPKIEYQKITEILLEEVREDKPDFEKARKLYVEINEPKEKSEEKLRQELIRENWWFQPEWREKNIPKEQVEITIGDKKLNIYNFAEPLTIEHLEKLERVIKESSQIKNGELLDRVKYILINDARKKSPYVENEEQNGFTYPNAQTIELNPPAIEFTPHRIKKVSNFEGTLIHEFSHNIVDTDVELFNKWNEKFGWEIIEQPIEKFPGGDPICYENEHPERCVSQYARLSPDEDIAESIVAALRDPKVLDPERLQFLKETLRLDKIDVVKAPEINIQRRSGKDIKLPQLESPVKYKR